MLLFFLLLPRRLDVVRFHVVNGKCSSNSSTKLVTYGLKKSGTYYKFVPLFSVQLSKLVCFLRKNHTSKAGSKDSYHLVIFDLPITNACSGQSTSTTTATTSTTSTTTSTTSSETTLTTSVTLFYATQS